MSLSELGTELWALAYHLYSTSSSATAAYQELCFRTNFSGGKNALAGSSPTSLRQLAESSWFTEMKKRYDGVVADAKASNGDDINELEDLLSGLYPNGCSLSDFADAVSTSTAMCSNAISQDAIDTFVNAEGERLQEEGQHELSIDALKTLVVGKLLLPSLIPNHWWCTSRKLSPLVLLKVGVRCSPPTIAFEYQMDGSTRHRVMNLEGIIASSGSTSAAVKKVHLANESLLSEAEVQKHLVHLQILMQKRQQEPESPSNLHKSSPATLPSASPTYQATAAAAASVSDPAKADSSGTTKSTSSAKKDDEPQQADVGLLYRDPEKALQNVDLNNADDVTLQEFKNVMNEKFMEKVLKPGDPGYVYDKRVDVKPTMKSDWDDDSD